MAEVSGNLTQIKVSGTAVPMVGEATTEDATHKIYQITSATKQVLDRTATIRAHLQGASDTAEAGTSTTTIKMATHGLVVGDLICNTTRSNAYRLVLTQADANTITVEAVTNQVSGDTIVKYPTEDPADYVLNRLNGTVTYDTATSRTIKISGSYLPLSVAAYAYQMGRNDSCELIDITKFGDGSRKRMAGLKSASGTLTNFYSEGETYNAALVAGDPVVIEDRTESTDEPNRTWALLESDEVASAIDGVTNQIVTWISHDEWIRLGV